MFLTQGLRWERRAEISSPSSNLTSYFTPTSLGERSGEEFDLSAHRGVSVWHITDVDIYLFNEYKLWSYKYVFPL